ncbi:MAG: hypothetical protein JWQ44_354 [Chthoniobacter sp.]|nr:hypothetical protein [Chthoniobacter sp.]
MRPSEEFAPLSMKWLDRAERKFEHLAIPNLIRVIVGFNVLVFVLYKLNPAVLSLLELDPEAVKRGEVWRLVTYIFIPSVGAPLVDWLFTALYLWSLWWVGNGLEEAIGSFRFNVFYLLGMVGTTVAAFFTDSNFSSVMLNASMFFGFARFYPDMVIYVMMILPVKVKWMAWVSGAMLLLGFIGGAWEYRLAVIAALSNYLLFFGREIFQDARHRGEVQTRRRRFEKAQLPADEALHTCATCGRTEHVAPDLEFRVAKDGNEYCSEHLPRTPVAS